MGTPTGAGPAPGERPFKASCGCLETTTRIIELCDGCLDVWIRMHEEARAAHLRTLAVPLP